MMLMKAGMGKPIRVLHITHNMAMGGAEIMIKQLVQSMTTNGYVSQVACLDAPIGEIGKALIEQGTKVHCLDREPGFDISIAKKIRHLVNEEKIEIVHCHQYTPFVYGSLGTLGSKAKVIFTEHGRLYPDTWSWKRRLVNQLLQRRPKAIVAISNATKNALISHEWFSERRMSIVYNGVEFESKPKNIELKKQLQLRDSTFLIGTVSRLDSIKNQALMVRALAVLAETTPDVALILVGDGAERTNLLRLAESLGVSDRVIVTGYVNCVENYLEIMDVFLLTSFSEGTSLALLEAMSKTKPIVATDVGGNAEILTDGESAFLIENDSLEQLVGRIKKYIENSELRDKIAGKAKTEFEIKYKASVMVGCYEYIYEKALAA